ncbi:MAG: ATP-binding protein [Bacteroidetes bacterium]|nr:ATP-binding protein [Bacteroidota bacterium]
MNIWSKLKLLLSLFACSCLSLMEASGQGNEEGYPFIRNFSADDYKANTQNFAVVQDHRGVMYFGNFAGILEYDGATWRIITTANISKVSSLACDSLGRIFAGARGEIGYLAPDRTGNMKFNSLNGLLQVNNRDFLDVISTFATPEGVYFVTEKSILLYDYDTITCLRSDSGILSSFFVNGILYYFVKDQGLMKLQGSQPLKVTESNGLPLATEITAMVPSSMNHVIVGTFNQGLYIMTQNGIEKFTTEADQDFESSTITCGIKMNDGTLVFGTARKGLITISSDGTNEQVIDKDAGLRNENVTGLFTDRSNSLWVTLNNGLALIEIPSPLSVSDERKRISGGVTGMVRLEQQLYVSTYQGLYRYSKEEKGFKAIPGITTACWSILPYDNDLLAATTEGVYEINGDDCRLICDGFSLVLCRSESNPSIVFAGQTDGLLILQKIQNHWTEKRTGISTEIREIAEDQNGNLWLNTPINGIYLCNTSDGTLIQKIDTTTGLPFMTGNHINDLSSGIILTTRQGLYHYSTITKSIEIFPMFQNDSIDRTIWLSRIIEDKSGNLWTTGGDEEDVTLYKKSGVTYEKFKTPFLPINDFVAWIIFPEEDGITWFGGPDGLIRYDPAVIKNYNAPFSTLLRKVTLKNDSVIFQGTFFNAGNIAVESQNANLIPEIDYAYNSVSFGYSSTGYYVNGVIRYQYFLEGFDRIWSEWRVENTKEYTNLTRGDYVFHVRSRNIYDKVSNETTFAFQILTPWYMAWWAYIIYIILVGVVIYFIVLLRSRKLVKEKQVLENIIQDRTTEVVRQKEEIEQKSLELSDKNEELEKINNVVKSINAELHFARLLQSVLEKMTMIRGVQRASAYIYDKGAEAYKLKANFGWDQKEVETIQFGLEEAEEKILKNTIEIYEDIFIKSDLRDTEDKKDPGKAGVARSMLILVIKVENRIEGFLILENMTKENAFSKKDFGFIKNSKEHIISAFIKTKILEDLQATLDNLKETQKQLIQSEKLASLGQLTAGIAHEIQNPLNFVNNFSNLSIDLAEELKGSLENLKKNVSSGSLEEMAETVEMLLSNVKKINEHGNRAERIVKGMLQHSRGVAGELLLTDVNVLVEEYVNLSYHGTRAENKEFNVTFKKDMDPAVGKVKIVPQDFSRVIINIVNNACYAVFEKSLRQKQGYSPEISISTKRLGKQIEIRIKDNGSGIPQAIIDKVFNPFFTTKPTGKGTGLGLSVSYDIIKNIHNGQLEVNSKEGESTEFIITIPDRG